MTTRIPVLSPCWTWPRQRQSSCRGTPRERCTARFSRSARGHALLTRESLRVHTAGASGPIRLRTAVLYFHFLGRIRRQPPQLIDDARVTCFGVSSGHLAGRLLPPSHRHSTAKPAGKEGSVAARARAARPRRSGRRRLPVSMARSGCGADDAEASGSVDEGPSVGASGPSPRTASRRAPSTSSLSLVPPRQASIRSAAAPRASGRSAHRRARSTAATLRIRSNASTAASPTAAVPAGRGDLDQVESVRIVAVGEVAQGGTARSVAAVPGGLENLWPVLGSRDGREAARGRHMECGSAVETLLRPTRTRPARSTPDVVQVAQLPLPSVEGALFLGGPHTPWRWIRGSRPPTAARAGARRRRAPRRRVRPRPPDRPGSGRGRARPGRAVPRRRRAGPARPGPRPSWCPRRRTCAAVPGRPACRTRRGGRGPRGRAPCVTRSRRGCPRRRRGAARSRRADRSDRGRDGRSRERFSTCQSWRGSRSTRVVQCRERFGSRCGERVQRAVAAAPLKQAEQRTAGRYDRIEHGKQPHIRRRRNRDPAHYLAA